jgi:hypothetical protein
MALVRGAADVGLENTRSLSQGELVGVAELYQS